MAQETKTALELGCRKSSGDEYVKCPNCVDERKKKNLKTLCVKHDENYAFCNHCQISYSLGGQQVYTDRPERSYVKPPPLTNVTDLSDNLVKWFKGRGISQGTLMELKVSEGVEWMPQVQVERNCIKFNYLIDDELVTIKYRDGSKNFKLFKDSQLVFYNLDSIKGVKKAIICEGEIGALTWHEIGKTNVISVPNGAQLSEKEKAEFLKTGKFSNQSTVNLSYIDNSYEYIKDIKGWYIATDTDAPGMKLRHELVRRLGADKCKIIEFGEHKDENDLLMAEGVLALETAYDNAKEVPIEGVFEANDHWADIEYVYDHGYDKGKTTGIEKLDPHFKWRLGELTIINGIPGHGKTNMILFLAVMASTQYGWKWAVYSPETHPVSYLWTLLIEIYMGKTSDRDKSFRMSKDELRMGADWVQEHFFVVDSETTGTCFELLEKFKSLVFRRGINAVIIDPWNDLITDKKPGEREDEYLQRSFSEIRRFKKTHNLHFIIAAHPILIRETDKDGKLIVPTSYHLSGGAMWFNRADNMITVYRDFDAHIYGESEIHVQKIKFQKLVGIPTHKNSPVLLYYNSYSQRFEDNPSDYALEEAAKKGEKEIKEATDYENGKVFNIKNETLDDKEESDDLPF